MKTVRSILAVCAMLIMLTLGVLSVSAFNRSPALPPADLTLGTATDQVFAMAMNGQLEMKPDAYGKDEAIFGRFTQAASSQPGSRPTHFHYSMTVQTGETWKVIYLAERVRNGKHGQGWGVRLAWHSYDGFWRIAGWSNMDVAMKSNDWQTPGTNDYNVLKTFVDRVLSAAIAEANACAANGTSC